MPMIQNEEFVRSLRAIYKFIYENSPVHRNVLRKYLINKGKVSSKEKFTKAFEFLVESEHLFMEREHVSINPKIMEVGVVQKQGDKVFIVTPNSKKHFYIDKGFASGLNHGDIVDIVMNPAGRADDIVILGKSQKTVSASNSHGERAPSKQVHRVMHGNIVLGRVVKLSHDNLVFIPNKKSFVTRQIPILNPKEDIASFQDRICCMDLVNLDAPLLGGYITEVKGEAGNPIHEYDSIAESYGGIMSWAGAEIEDEISKIPMSVDVSKLSLITEEQAPFLQRKHTVDMRHLPFRTVDPENCRDMDDAIYATFNENGDYVCYTAVANVTKYVDLNSEIGQRYINSCFTIYAPNKAYNILPSELSTGICSLNPGEDRLALVIKTVIDKDTGEVKDSSIYDALIQSHGKYSYEQAQAIVDEYSNVITREYLMDKWVSGEELTAEEHIILDYYAAQAIKVEFEERKMIRFVSNRERRIIFDEDFQNVVGIDPIPHLYYHEVIEAFMITANEAAARYAHTNNLDYIYRVHDAPNPRKVDRANEFFEILGIEFDGDLSAEGTRMLIDLIRDTPNEEIVNKFLIKMQSRAVYSDHLPSNKDNVKDEMLDMLGEIITHYAIRAKFYGHSTSPIRRGPDYVTHYNILAHMHGTKPLSASTVRKIVEIANERQLDVDQAEKDFEDISSVMYCEKHIGEQMAGRVSKIRYASVEEGYEDSIVAIVKNDELGISVEIPLSQIIGRPANDCELSEQRCAVYDRRGNTVLALCKPIEFIIEKADRKAMIVVGKTNKELIRSAEIRDEMKSREKRNGEYYRNLERRKRKNRLNSTRTHERIDDETESEST